MEIIEKHPLASHTTVGIGGPADVFITTNTTEEFVETLKKYSQNKITIIGNGSNILISDSGIRGVVIKNLANKIEYLPNYQVKCDSGVQLPFLISDTISHSLSGLEEFAYIPSTIGGAIYGNIHGINKNYLSSLISTVDVFDLKTKNINTIPGNQLKWDYDFSEFQLHSDWIILSATLKLTPGNRKSLQETVTNIISQKSQTQSMNSLGSVFKNPLSDSAGHIIDQKLNLKGFRIGDAQVSPLHANFIINLGHATAKDYLDIIRKIQSEAKSKLNLSLEPEIKFLGDFS